MIKGLKSSEIKSEFKKFLDEKRHWCIVTKSNKGRQFIGRIGRTHYCFDEDKFAVFPVRHMSQDIVLVGFPEKSRVTPELMSKYLGEFGLPTTLEEMGNQDIIILPGNEDEGQKLLVWMVSIVGEKYFV